YLFLFIHRDRANNKTTSPLKMLINSENPRGRRPVTGPHAGKDPQKKPDFSGLVSDGFQYAIDVAVIARVCAIVPPAYRASG
ncbi:TPA: hypothetical protein ACH9PH_005592, partial [Escherichia coli]